jgi:hypothetical protein
MEAIPIFDLRSPKSQIKRIHESNKSSALTISNEIQIRNHNNHLVITSSVRGF